MEARVGAAAMVALLSLAAGARGQQGSDAEVTVTGPIAEAIDGYLTRCVPFGFAGSVLAVKDGAVILSKGYGIADRRTGAACTPATIHDLGHVAQPLTACAVLVLEQRKKLQTRDTLDAYFGDVPSDKRKIQLHHLLTHTSGLPRTPSSIAEKVATREQLVQEAMRVPLRDPPGTEFTSCDANYALLAAVVELVTKQPFEEALEELVLRPAGLASTGFRQGRGLDTARVARAFTGTGEPLPAGMHATSLPDERASGESELASEGWYTWGLRGAGGILGTAPDLWRFEQALRGDALLTKESRKKLFTPQLATNAYGWQVLKGRPASIECRGWSSSGFGSRCARFPDQGAFLVLLANQAAALEVVEQDVRALLFGGSVTLPPETRSQPAEALASLAGEYGSPSGARWRLSASADALVLEALTPAALELQAGKLGGDQKLIVKHSAKILAGLPGADFSQVRELDETSRMHGIEDWWRGLLELHGRLESSTLLGLIQDAKQMNHVVARLEFERGEELLDLTWGDELFIGLHTGPPFASRLRLVPAEEGFVAYDLVRRKRLGTARPGADGTLELELPGGKTAAKKL